MEPMSASSWFVKCGAAIALPLLVYAAIAAAGPKAPPLPTGRDGALEVLDRYSQGPVPDIVLVGSSITTRLKEEYFDAPNLKTLGLAGGSSITGLKVLIGRERLPKIVLIEMNMLERGEDPALVQRFTANTSTLPYPIRAAVAFYERWLHAPPDRHQADSMVAALLQARPSDFDNRVYLDRAMREWSVPASTADMTRNAATLVRLVKQIEARGSLVYFYSLPYAEALQGSDYARATANIAHATFTNELQWLRLELPIHELRWADGVHLDERSAIVVAKELQKQLLLRNRPLPTQDN
ncbi:hypothetical protein [Bradyrhizobium sp. URHD0069]|uniref:hypothetical protein n=1 Tax=Bradyrhizobium sp. URHD0069 TaxID=1380355 RepID=UPI00055EF8AC|nr:hypothetical protein [Bradyrhizobium sp. URHD0069]